MRIFILDDDANVIRILEKIIHDRSLGTVVGKAMDGKEGYEKIESLKPDLILIDLLMPGEDGISIVRKLKSVYSNMEFIMISQVSSKDMVEKAYKHGVEYYIYKPINALEVEIIIKKVKERMQIDKTLMKIQELFSDKEVSIENRDEKDSCEQCIKNILKKLGIMGEKGSYDIIKVCEYIINNNVDISNMTIRNLCNNFSENPKSMEQRMRRTIAVAMSNIASLGIEDYMNDIFVEYSSSLFNFEQVKKEMDFIRGKNQRGGSVNTKKFIAGLITHCENKNN
ncbi:response regulator [Anaerosalibacter bizertensis]|uniref:Response regulator n=1 Tax=Anaerosalibacter bizertensis TaxID=932217 RepID=A0A844FFM3_9FIRM|nr:response regulator [Anaerosalibacter bizertensis]MBV1817222.1 response regulator [Bacteroidales bacterium MSK.15.36]HHV25815.1 response regulator [Tissierellia bacterium]MBU5293563.1 response regulator [Anaerosalibacter bizertensis]MCB5559428.1 response regulator [Anaerosalibacter bizertensis]MCG4564375.1 response regulator [Anaerosalibacter bizertensis]